MENSMKIINIFFEPFPNLLWIWNKKTIQQPQLSWLWLTSTNLNLGLLTFGLDSPWVLGEDRQLCLSSDLVTVILHFIFYCLFLLQKYIYLSFRLCLNNNLIRLINIAWTRTDGQEGKEGSEENADKNTSKIRNLEKEIIVSVKSHYFFIF